jgi:hypothetical protein
MNDTLTPSRDDVLPSVAPVASWWCTPAVIKPQAGCGLRCAGSSYTIIRLATSTYAYRERNANVRLLVAS